MNGELAQVIALATHGTAWLRDPQGPPPALATTSSTFGFVRSVAFALEERRGLLGRRRVTTLPDLAAWFERLRRAGRTRLWLLIPTATPHEVGGFRVDPHMLAGFAGAGSWLLVATGGGQPEVWRPSWSVAAPDAPDRRIWDVRYDGLVAQADVPVPQPAAAEARAALHAVLTDAHDFAQAHELSPWTDWFATALQALSGDAPELPFHDDMLPPGYPPEGQRLLAGAAQSWVFGGMGSWNDMGFETDEDNDRYNDLSRRLYDAMLTAFVAAVNIEL